MQSIAKSVSFASVSVYAQLIKVRIKINGWNLIHPKVEINRERVILTHTAHTERETLESWSHCPTSQHPSICSFWVMIQQYDPADNSIWRRSLQGFNSFMRCDLIYLSVHSAWSPPTIPFAKYLITVSQFALTVLRSGHIDTHDSLRLEKKNKNKICWRNYREARCVLWIFVSSHLTDNSSFILIFLLFST